MENVKNKIIEGIKKQEYDYNHQTVPSIDLNQLYNDQVIGFINDGNHAPTSFQDKKKAIDIHKKYLVNTSKSSTIKINMHACFHVDNNISCHYQIKYYEPMKKEIYQLLQKLSFKNVNMDELIDDLYKHGFNVNQLLVDLSRYDKHGDIPAIFTQLDIANLIPIVYRHGVTAKMLLENPYVHDLIKQSPGGAAIFSFQNIKPQPFHGSSKVSDRRLIKMIDVFSIYHYKPKHDELTVVNVNWCLL